ncbi:MAG: ABC transporter permease subunit [Kiritimatiellia bacterium]
MNLLLTLIWREWEQLIRSVHGLLPLFFAMGASGALLVWLLRRAEGCFETLPALWGLSVAFGLPFLAAVAASRGFTHDREIGMMRLMFATPVRARYWVLGKVFAAWLLCIIYVGGTGLSCWIIIHWILPETAQIPGAWQGFLFALFALSLQSLLWSSIGTFVSLFTRSSAATIFLVLLVCLLAPPAVYLLLTLWFPELRAQWPWFPLQEQIYDCAGGIIDGRTMIGYLSASCVLIYAAGIMFDASRLCATER